VNAPVLSFQEFGAAALLFEAGQRPREKDVVHAPADAGFVGGYLLPALNLPPSRVLLVDELALGG
jgi:hypothetical protein